MKKITLSLMALLMLTISPLTSIAKTEIKQETIAATKAINQAEADALIVRLNEINDLDKSNLNSTEKSELRNEVLSIQNQLMSNPVYIYISGGALLLIIILLIILL